MPRLKEVAIDERALEELIVNDPEVIEEGLRVVARQFPTDSGPLDLLCVDADEVAVVIELKNEVNDDQLSRALGTTITWQPTYQA